MRRGAIARAAGPARVCAIAGGALALACGHTPTPPPPASASTVGDGAVAAPPPWATPPGWQAETIPFPLAFAPALAHTGVEELRFPPGVFDRTAPAYWSYTFVWRTVDPAALDAAALSDELTSYFRGLVAAVAEPPPSGAAAEQIVVRAIAQGASFTLAASILDAFGDGGPVELTGRAQRTPCRTGALWVFTFAPSGSSFRDEIEALARSATCR
jgi:hypothetical protein